MRKAVAVAIALLSGLLSVTQAIPACFSGSCGKIAPTKVDSNSIGEFFSFVGDELNKNKRTKRLVQLDIADYVNSVEAKDEEPRVCTSCADGVKVGQVLISQGWSQEEFNNFVTDMCIGTHYRSPKICQEGVELLGPEIYIILSNATNSPRDICSFVHNTECGNGDVPGHRWKVQLPDIPKPLAKARLTPTPNTPKLKVLHITDTHYDPNYVEGSKDQCDDPICCREESGFPGENETAAGKWGGKKCDIPERTLDNMLQHITETHKDIDYIIWTGDIPTYKIWGQSVEDSITLLNNSISKIKEYFSDTPVFPALGNHEPSPPNNFPPPVLHIDDTISWFYQELVKGWSKFLPNSTYETIREAGYYIAEARTGFKIISLNTNFCFFENWWLILNSTDPANQLQWFIEQLQNAETNKETVHVIAHIPPGYNDCLKIWSENYNAIISRYESTVTAQFFGHTHTDGIEVYYDSEDNTRPVSVSYVGPSATTFPKLNPGYRVYSIDGDHSESNRDVYDFDTWIMNLTDANLNDNPLWYKMFSAKESYELASLLPEEWNGFYERLKTDQELLETYNRHYWKGEPLEAPCNANCRRHLLCEIRSCAHYGEPTIK